MAEESPRGPVSAEKSPRGPVSNGVNGIRKDRFSQKESPRKSITELGQIQARPKITSLDQCKGSFLQSAKENMRKRSFTLAADEMNKAMLGDELDEKTKEDIRKGCILLQDALAGRASHGLYSLLDEPEWKRTLFQIQTADSWQQVVLTASMVHASLIVWEAPNHRASWIDPTLDPLWVIIAEFICICIYASDVGMKMLYFGGWRDYVSKEWQRNYVMMIAGFSIDLALYSLRLNPFRFSRPVRLFVIAGRHRDVRRLASFLPRMAQKLVATFAKPMLASLVFFGPLFVRIYGKLPEDKKLDFGDDDFNNIFSSMRTLFMLATMDNFHPVVGEAFRINPVSFVIFGAFVVVTGFFLMSVALGVIFDLYIEDHHKTVESEEKKEKKSVAKAFDKLDLEKKGHITWLEFREMMKHLRPWDYVDPHVLRIFKELATELPATETAEDTTTKDTSKDTSKDATKDTTDASSVASNEDGLLVVQKEKFGQIGSYLGVVFVKSSQRTSMLDPSWLFFEEWWVRLDAMIIIAGWDDFRIPIPLLNITGAITAVCEVNPWMDMRTASVLPDHVVEWQELQLGTLVLALSFLALFFKATHRWSSFRLIFEHRWRQQDLVLLLICGAAHALHSLCVFPESTYGLLSAEAAMCEAPYRQVLDMIAAFRIIRAFAHHEGSRKYLEATIQVGPVLMHIGGLSLAVLYFTSVTVMEMLAKKPAVLLTSDGFRLNLPCNRPLPNFDCASSAMLSSFELFVEENWGEVLHLAVPEEGEPHTLYYNLVSFYFIIAYTVLGICLCNLLTTLVVEFHKCLMDEEKEKEKAKKKERPRRMSTLVTGIKKKLLLMKKLGVVGGALTHMGSDEDLIMTGINNGSWRKRLKTPA
mmetsp:Transcript_25034/g.59648  ORF Transcript_25034/g.59648 Transcript_25034/m.59648 type:complete len:870 (-) Transcript_25034:211-2820(-)